MKAGTVLLKKVSQPEFLKDVSKKGDLIRTRLNELKNKVSIIGDIRGQGLMVGTEFVDPKGQKDLQGSLPACGEIAAKVQKLCFENFLVVEKGGRNGSVMRCLCALNISEEDVNKAMDIFEKCVLQVNEEYK
jgi:diaminobutyrate-2-oxoglutarate transaminase